MQKSAPNWLKQFEKRKSNLVNKESLFAGFGQFPALTKCEEETPESEKVDEWVLQLHHDLKNFDIAVCYFRRKDAIAPFEAGPSTVSDSDMVALISAANYALDSDDPEVIRSRLEGVSLSVRDEGLVLKERLTWLACLAAELQQLHSKKYSAESSLTYAAVTSFACLGSLVTSYWFDALVIHPFLAWVGLIWSVGFAILAAWRLRSERS